MKYFSAMVKWLGLVIGIVFVLSAADGCISSFRKPPREYSVTSGQAVKIAEKAPRPLTHPGMISFSSSCPSIRLIVTEIQGRLWNGTIVVPDATQSGSCKLSVRYSGDPRITHNYHIRIFPNREALLSNSYSLFEKWAGWNPWMIMAVSSVTMVMLMVISYLLSLRQEQQPRNFRAVTAVTNDPQRLYVTFPYLRGDDLEPGQPVALINDHGNIVGLATISKITRSNILAIASREEDFNISAVSWEFDDVMRALEAQRGKHVREG
ncbi:MAG: hypothetical protein JRI45_10340 [Deltaproteobacteria bacterium]|nr:hypothetical protein [Deltaproteobacteria bacterium]MBW2067652.1 hypothetical protein [Deltaproteobacteria bacterium]